MAAGREEGHRQHDVARVKGRRREQRLEQRLVEVVRLAVAPLHRRGADRRAVPRQVEVKNGRRSQTVDDDAPPLLATFQSRLGTRIRAPTIERPVEPPVLYLSVRLRPFQRFLQDGLLPPLRRHDRTKHRLPPLIQSERRRVRPVDLHTAIDNGGVLRDAAGVVLIKSVEERLW